MPRRARCCSRAVTRVSRQTECSFTLAPRYRSRSPPDGSADGTGTPLQTFNIPANVALNGTYSTWTLRQFSFSQPAQSIKLSGTGNKWGIDDLTSNFLGCPAPGPTGSDCNQNGFDDACEISNGFALDCNGNGVPDSCDVSGQQAYTSISFEEFRGAASTVITDQYPGLVFEPGPNGSKWAANDVTVRPSNAVGWDCETETATGLQTNYPNYWLCGQVWCATENPYTGSGTIRLTGNGASFFQLRYCAGSDLYLIAYDSGGTQIDIDVKPKNRRLTDGNYSGPGTLRVEAPAGKRIASVMVHDSGNQWLIDGISTDVGVIAPLPDCNTNGIPDSCELADGSAVDQNGNGVPDSCDPYPVLRLTTNAAACNPIGSTVTVDATLSGVLNNVVAGQMLLAWDVSKLSFAAVLPGDAPYTTAYALNEQAGTIMILASTSGGGTTAAAAVVSRIQFTVSGGSCSGTGNEVGFFTFGPMVTEFTDGFGGATVPTLLASAGFVVDDGAPVLTNVPADVTVQADAGMGSFATVALTPPTATDACSPMTESSSRSDGASLGAAFPVGTTTVTWSAADPCGNTTTATTSVTVSPYNTMDFTVAWQGLSGNFNRNLTLVVRGSSGDQTRSPFAVSAANGTATFSVSDLSVDNYSCATVEDAAHTLRRQMTVSDSGETWSASGDLVSGDIINDEVIDVLDWGAYVVRNTNADLNADGSINANDGNIILANFGMQGDSACGAGTPGRPGVTSISVSDLVARGLGDLAGADLNSDGWLDELDMEMFNN